MANIEDSAQKNQYNDLNGHAFIKESKNGTLSKVLIIKRLELEYHQEIELIKLNQNIKTTADAIRWALKRANGKI